MIYLATRPEGVHVLHCFQKKYPKDEPFGFGSSDEAI